MQRLCDICNKNIATVSEVAATGNRRYEFCFCDRCYQDALKRGVDPVAAARERLARRGYECEACGYTKEQFDADYLFGCPDCYYSMSKVAEEEVKKAFSRTPTFNGNGAMLFRDVPYGGPDRKDLTDYVASSRVRFARNVRGLSFPKYMQEQARRGSLPEAQREFARKLINGAMLATDGVFDAELYEMTELEPIKKRMLIERHLISPVLAANDFGAVIIERGEPSELSVMLNEEDHVRAQCVRKGFDLFGAFKRAKAYADNLQRYLPIAHDPRMGYLTACPTNLGAGIRASAMVFLPALTYLGSIDETIDDICRVFGATVRGYFGEGSAADYDMYQISNRETSAYYATYGDRTAGCTVGLVERAVIALCREEERATDALFRSERTRLVDRIQRSYGILLHAHTLEEDELMQLIVDVKFGVRLGMIDIETRALDAIIDDCASALEILSDGLDKEQRGIKRAAIVRYRLGVK